MPRKKKNQSKILFTKNMVEELANYTNYSKKTCNEVLSAFMTVTGSAMKEGYTVNLIGFGKFKPTKIKSYKIISIHNKETKKIKKHVRPTFTAGKILKEYVQ